MRVVPIHAPRRQNSLGEAILARPPDVIHDLLTTIFDNRFPNSRCNIIKHFIPTDALPFSFTTFARTLQRIKNAIRISNLIQCRRPFRTIPPARSRILRIALELLNLIRIFVDVGEQSTRRLAVEARRWHELITPFLPPRPRLRIQLSPIIPALFGWKGREMNERGAGIEGFVVHRPNHDRNVRSNSLAASPDPGISLRSTPGFTLTPLRGLNIHLTLAVKTSSIRYGLRQPLDAASCRRLSVQTGYDTPLNDTSPS